MLTLVRAWKTGTESDVDHGGRAQGILKKSNIINWVKDHSCNSWQKMWLLSASIPRHLSEAKLKSFGLISLTELMSRQPHVDFIA